MEGENHKDTRNLSLVSVLYKKLCQYRDHALTSASGVESQAWKSRVLTTPAGQAGVSVSENYV